MKRRFCTVGLLVFSVCLCGRVGDAQTQADLNEMSAKEAEKADAALNKTYKQLVGMLDAEALEKLKASQRAWIKFRDAECDFEADTWRGGSIVPMMHSSCFRKLTEVRTAQLKQHIESLKPH